MSPVRSFRGLPSMANQALESSNHFLVFIDPTRSRIPQFALSLFVSLLGLTFPVTRTGSALAQQYTDSSFAEKGTEPIRGAAAASDQGSNIAELEVIKEEENVVIAGGLYPGREQPISKAPSNVYVITDEDIRHSGAVDLPTVLRRVPGIDVMQVTGADFNVSARGDNQLRANKMLVLVDGRSIYLDWQGQVLWRNIPITLPEIKRIEVLKGPAAALYGFNAFDGVINIITKSPEELKGTILQFGGGELGTISSAAVTAGVHGKFGYRLSAGHNQTAQWDSRESLAFRNNLLNTQFEYALPGDSKVILQGGLVDSNRFDGPIVDTIAVSQKPNQRYVNAVYDRPNFFIRAFWTGSTETALNQTNPLISRFFQTVPGNHDLEGNSYNIEAQHAINLWAGNRFTYGVNYRHNTVSSNFLEGYTREDRLGLYLQDEWRMTEALTAVVGIRYDLDTFINPTISPKGSLIYTPWENHTFRASVSVGYRPPTMFESRFLGRSLITIPPAPPFFPGAQIPGVLIGSNQLAPEQIISYDVGYQGWFWKHRLRTRIDLFYNHISDLITNSNLSTPPTFFNGGTQGFQGQGGGSADIYGGEAGLEVLVTSWLSGFANYSYQEIHQTYTVSNDLSSNRVARGAPRFKANAGLRAEFDNGLNGEAVLHYVGAARYPIDPGFAVFLAPPFTVPGTQPPDTRVGSYYLLNVRGAYKLWQERRTGREAEVAVTAFNALNDKHKEHPLGETIGSRVMGWLTIRY